MLHPIDVKHLVKLRKQGFQTFQVWNELFFVFKQSLISIEWKILETYFLLKIFRVLSQRFSVSQCLGGAFFPFL